MDMERFQQAIPINNLKGVGSEATSEFIEPKLDIMNTLHDFPTFKFNGYV